MKYMLYLNLWNIVFVYTHMQICLQAYTHAHTHTPLCYLTFSLHAIQHRGFSGLFCIYSYALCCIQLFSHVQLFATQWTVTHQAPLSMEFSNKNTRVGCHALLQGIFPSQGSNWNLLHCRWILYQLSLQGRSSIAIISLKSPL